MSQPTLSSGRQKRIPMEELIAAYQQTGSVWKAGKKLGIGGQTVHERLKSAGVPMMHRAWTDEEIAELGVLVGECTISEIADRLGRSYAAIACQIHELGIGSRFGNRRSSKVPRGKGYDKESIRKYIRALDDNPAIPITRYARQNSLSIELLVQAIEKNFPEWWLAYRAAHSDLPQKKCTGCGTVFIPSNGKQQFCRRACASAHRSDQQYFGGQRKNTIGLASGICQLCGKKPDKGLSSHHMYGKQNDPDNRYLIALCTGCHQLVTLTGNRDWDEHHWEALITLAWLRKHGPEYASGEISDNHVLEVCVEIENSRWSDEDLAEWAAHPEEDTA